MDSRGFGIAVDSATDIDDGVVITDGTNEFVWIPVSDTDLAEMYSTTTPETAADTALSKSSLGETTTTTKIYSRLRAANAVMGGAPGSTGYREPDFLADTSWGDACTSGLNQLNSNLGYTGTSAQILKNFAQDMVDEYLVVFNSIKKYDGFYIGRYELTGSSDNPTVQRYQPVLNTSSSGMGGFWYSLKSACNRVITGENKKAQSHMIYGNQWDEVIDWLVDSGGRSNEEVYIDSSEWGNIASGDPQDSGSNDVWSANNIYDLAGNYPEWTQEANDGINRVIRGGGWNMDNAVYGRYAQPPYGALTQYSTRVALYIK